MKSVKSQLLEGAFKQTGQNGQLELATLLKPDEAEHYATLAWSR
jgi:hypothetical protein